MRNLISCLLVFAALAAAQSRKSGSPLDALPPNVEMLTHFGERADFSPANDAVAFMAKSFGDAFTIDLQTRAIRCLTCNVPGAAFLRVMHLSTGDYLLIGPERFTTLRDGRHRDNELWLLRRKPGATPERLDQKMSEGAALSKQSLKVAFAQTSSQNPDLPKGSSRLITAEVDLARPGLRNVKVVHSSPSSECTLEAQDFFDNDRKLTFTCYEPQNRASVYVIDLESGRITPQSASIGAYNEVEGIFPGGLHTCVESDQHAQRAGWEGGFRNIDVWKLRLDGTGKQFERLTFFNDYEGWKASNPVISTDGRFMAFQAAKTADEAGVGYGILLQRLR